DTMNGEDGNDIYIVDNTNDVVQEFSFDDALGGQDLIRASVTYTLGSSIELLTLTGTAAANGTGNEKNNVITGNGSSNVLSGLDGNDTLNGGDGTDQLEGGNGDDLLIGGAGADALIGGLGADHFKYKLVTDSLAGGGKDAIINFQAGSGIGDQIDLADIDANVLLTGNQTFTWIGGGAFTGAGQLRYAGGIVQGNTDTDSTAEFEIQLLGGPVLFVNPAATGTDILL
ncbi:MAG TPA: calcium-binding protein, partial [Gemmatales bacterium]|nr:calcium-binding protein [Gemmatales bacterium]